jgi:hypothetical protein
VAALAGGPGVFLEAEADARGSFEFPDALEVLEQLDRPMRRDSDGTAEVRVLAPGFAPAVSDPFPLARDAELPPIALAPGRTIRGRVLDAAGSPIAAAEVWVEDPRGSTSTCTDGEGSFAIRDLAPGRHPIAVGGAGIARAVREVVDLTSRSEAFVEIRIDRGLTIRGRVVDPDGNGVASARVSASLPRRRAALGSVETDADGSFALGGLPAGRYLLVAEAKGYTPERLARLVEPGSDGIEIRLSRAGAIDVVVTRGGVPAGDDVEIYFACGTDKAAFHEGPHRQPSLEGLLTGRYVIVAVAGEDLGMSRPIDLVAGAREHVRIAARPAGAVAGRVLARGAGVAGASVSANGVRYELMEEAGLSGPLAEEVRDLLDALVPEAHTDSQGRFALRGVPTGDVRLAAREASVGRGEIELRIPSGGSLRADVVLDSRTVVSGTVLEWTGAPLAGGRFLLKPETLSLEETVSFETDEEGRYRVDRVAPGNYFAVHELPDLSYVVPMARVVVSAGEAVEFDFSAGLIAVSGRVTREGEPAAGVRVVFFDEADPEGVSAVTDARGRYGLLARRPGEFKVRLDDGPPLRTLVPADSRVTRDFTLPP